MYSLTINADTIEELDRYVHALDAYALLDDLRMKLRSHTKHEAPLTIAEFNDFFYQCLSEYDIGHLIP
jgi:hypothetical protein